MSVGNVRALAVQCARIFAVAALALLCAAPAWAAPEGHGGEASLKLPDLSQVQFLGVDGHRLLTFGLLFCVFGLAFGMVIYTRLRNLPVHRAMREGGAYNSLMKPLENISELSIAVKRAAAYRRLQLEREALQARALADAERLHLLITNIGDAILSADVQGKLTVVNPAAERILGKTRQEFLLQFADWLTAPVLQRQRLADNPRDRRLRAHYHWIDGPVDFIYLDNATADQFDSAQMTWLRGVLQRAGHVVHLNPLPIAEQRQLRRRSKILELWSQLLQILLHHLRWRQLILRGRSRILRGGNSGCPLGGFFLGALRLPLTLHHRLQNGVAHPFLFQAQEVIGRQIKSVRRRRNLHDDEVLAQARLHHL